MMRRALKFINEVCEKRGNIIFAAAGAATVPDEKNCDSRERNDQELERKNIRRDKFAQKYLSK